MPSVAIGSVDEMSAPKSMKWFTLRFGSMLPSRLSAHSSVPVATIAISVPITAYRKMVPKLAKNLRLRIVKPASKISGGSSP